MYTVKSGYELAKNLCDKESGRWSRNEHSNRNGEEKSVWKCLCHLNMKHKLKHFVWNCLREILHVNAVINGRIGNGELFNKCCGDQDETLEHMLFHCNNAELIWKMVLIPWKALNQFRRNFWKWWSELLGAANRDEENKHIVLTTKHCMVDLKFEECQTIQW
ncbi:hypothetical protein ACH5RR_008293 [Cinchona calisaya]|uniref:Reverse transcriptase zinc-binding domain-containing protein n=1 Tax=Cinchona calisaya TaxID=153742 RepID=A0ABD3ADH4_9GENT